MFTILRQAFRRTAQNWKIVLLIFLVNLGLGLFIAFPAFNILQTESQNSLAFDNLVADFDFTVISDFLRNTIILAVTHGQAFSFNTKAIKLTSAI